MLPAAIKGMAFQLEVGDSSDDESNRISPCCEVVFFLLLVTVCDMILSYIVSMVATIVYKLFTPYCNLFKLFTLHYCYNLNALDRKSVV